MKKTIKIQKNNSSFLSVNLKDILVQIEKGEKYFWNILWIEATGKPENMNMLEFEEEVNNSENGYILSWDDLQKLSESLFQVINLLLIGDEKKENLKRYSSDGEMNLKCTFCIELVDSSYWEVNSQDLISVKNLTQNLSGVELVN